MTALQDTVFLLDVDNTLLDNDQVIADLRAHLEQEFGPDCAGHYWVHFEALREELGYADYLGALQRYRLGPGHGHAHGHAHGDDDGSRLLQMSSYLIDYPFASRLYSGALEVIARLNTLGRTVILSDGDVVFQPRKVQRSGLWDAVAGRVLIYIHKEHKLEAVQRHYPAQHYVMVDDKLRVLAAMKSVMAHRLTTVIPRQGHYALDPAAVAAYPPADLSLERIGDLLNMDIPNVLALRETR